MIIHSCWWTYLPVVFSTNALVLSINVLLANQSFVSFARLCQSYIVEELINGSVVSISDRIVVVDVVFI